MFFSHISLSVRSLFPYPNPLSKDEKRSSALEFRPVGWVSGWDSPTKIERKRSCSALFRSKDEKREHCILRGSLVTSEKYCSSDCLLAEENVTCNYESSRMDWWRWLVAIACLATLVSGVGADAAASSQEVVPNSNYFLKGVQIQGMPGLDTENLSFVGDLVGARTGAAAWPRQ
jgi:hypothetical protein